jgi:hypothetical protein
MLVTIGIEYGITDQLLIIILNLGVCILLRVLDQIEKFPMYIFPHEDGHMTETCSG